MRNALRDALVEWETAPGQRRLVADQRIQESSLSGRMLAKMRLGARGAPGCWEATCDFDGEARIPYATRPNNA